MSGDVPTSLGELGGARIQVIRYALSLFSDVASAGGDREVTSNPAQGDAERGSQTGTE